MPKRYNQLEFQWCDVKVIPIKKIKLIFLIGSDGHFPNCICKDGKVYVPQTSECVEVDKTKCPSGSKKVNNKCVCDHRNGFKYEFDDIFWICRPWYG